MFSYLFDPLPNAIMTVLVGLSAIYWLVTFVSGDFLGDLDVGAPEGLDVDSDLDGAEPSFFSKALEFINVGKVPIMVVISTFKLISWLFTLATSMIWNIGAWGWKSALILLPIFFIAYFLTRWATKPLIKVYKTMGYNGEEAHELIGRTGYMRSNIEGDKLGYAEVVIMKDVIRVLVKSKSQQRIPYNTEVTLVDEADGGKYYWVIPEITVQNVLND